MPSKKILILLLSVVILALAWYWFFGQRYKAPNPTGETKEQKFLRESTTAPAGAVPQVPKEILNKVTAPSQGKPVSPDIIKSLTAPTP